MINRLDIKRLQAVTSNFAEADKATDKIKQDKGTAAAAKQR